MATRWAAATTRRASRIGVAEERDGGCVAEKGNVTEVHQQRMRAHFPKNDASMAVPLRATHYETHTCGQPANGSATALGSVPHWLPFLHSHSSGGGGGA